MAEIIPTTLSQFYEVEKSLIADLLDNKLTFSEARERYKLMCEFIPNNVEINPVELDVLMKLRFKDDPNWKKQERIYKIEVGHIPDENVTAYVRELAERMKQNSKLK